MKILILLLLLNFLSNVYCGDDDVCHCRQDSSPKKCDKCSGDVNGNDCSVDSDCYVCKFIYPN